MASGNISYMKIKKHEATHFKKLFINGLKDLDCAL